MGLSYTPSHNESHFYQWDNKKVSNLSIYLDDDYKLNLGKNYQLMGYLSVMKEGDISKTIDTV